MTEAKLLKLLSILHLEPDRIRRTAHNIQIRCPFAKERHKDGIDQYPSFSIELSDKTSRVYCFGCGFRGTVVHMVAALQKTNAMAERVLPRVMELERQSFDWQRDFDDRGARKELHEVDAEDAIKYWRSCHHEYMEERKFTHDVIGAWEMGWDSRLGTLVLPVRLRDRTLVGAVGRLQKPIGAKKYHNYFGLVRSQVVLGEQLVRPGNALIVSEGALDAPSVWKLLNQHNVLNRWSVVSTFGASVNPVQADRLVSLADRIILFYDNDDPGRKATEDLRYFLGDRVALSKVQWPEGYDRWDADQLINEKPEMALDLLEHPKILF